MRLLRLRYAILILPVLLLAGRVFASQTHVGIEAETGARQGNAVVMSDVAASGGQALRFGAQDNTKMGWDLTRQNTGLASLGLNCEAMPVYTGDYAVPAGTVISEKRITGQLALAAGNITIERSCLRPEPGGVGQGMPFISTTNYNTMTTTQNKVIIRDSDCDGSRLDTKIAAWSICFMGVADLINNYITGFGSGIGLMGTGGHLDAMIENNYVTGLVAWGNPATDGNHSDAFTVRDFNASAYPNRQLVIRNNRFICDSSSCTGAFFVQTYAGQIDNMLAEGNLLGGGGWQLGLNQLNYPYSNLRYVNNRFTPGQGYGAAYVQGGSGWTQWSENYMNAPGQPGNKGASVGKP